MQFIAHHRALTRCCISAIKNGPFIADYQRGLQVCFVPFYQIRFNSSGSVSSKEISKFSSLSPTWWNSSHNPLLSMNPIRIKRILQVIQSQHSLPRCKDSNTENLQVISAFQNKQLPLLGMKALDVGCGGGVLSESLARLGASVTAIDPSEDIVNVAKDRAKLDKRITNTIDYRGGISVEDLACNPSQHGMYDIICILEVIEHSADPRSLIQAASKLLKRPVTSNMKVEVAGDVFTSLEAIAPGGTLFISTLNRTMKSYIFGIFGAEYVMNILPVGTHNWTQFKTPKEVEEMVQDIHHTPTLEKNGNENDESLKLHQLDVCGMVFAPDVLTKSFEWQLDTNDLDMNWIGSYGWRNVKKTECTQSK